MGAGIILREKIEVVFSPQNFLISLYNRLDFFKVIYKCLSLKFLDFLHLLNQLIFLDYNQESTSQ